MSPLVIHVNGDACVHARRMSIQCECVSCECRADLLVTDRLAAD